MNTPESYRVPDEWPTKDGGHSVGQTEHATSQDTTEEWPTLPPQRQVMYHPLSDDRIFSKEAMDAIGSYNKRRNREAPAGDNDQASSDMSTIPSDPIDPLQRLKDVAEESENIPSWLRWETSAKRSNR